MQTLIVILPEKVQNLEATTTSEATIEPNTSSMEYDVIPHYLKMMSSMAPKNNQENMNINPNIQEKYQQQC